ncbi:MAG: OmpA family protein [Bacteroidota bacterium]|nr:OmpA family protein [Bacteroidota bacterium]MDP3146218.1 OmpA family protein [Bacteroidota bacterium]MDP3556629.1 OmpA family protein [Bacteroidota bacterium]
MKNITKFTLTAAALVIFVANGFSQKLLKKADAAFEARQYFNAINMYKQAYASAPKDKKASIMFKSGYASQEINDYKGAETFYQKAIAANYDDPTVYFRLAEVLKSQMKYPEAIIEFNNYKAKGGNAKKADLGVKSCELAQQWKDAPQRYKIENMSLINSKESDYSPSYSDKKYKTLVFTSRREGALGSQEVNVGSNHSDIFETKLDKNGKWSTPVLLPPSISSPVNEGQGWVSKKGDMIFFTRCPEEKNKQVKCGLYMAKKQGSTWGVATRLPFNNDTVQFGHPTLSADGKFLYFTSRMSGGYGGLDIWRCTFDPKANVWGQPTNAGPAVNTEGNEMFPTISDDGKKLYFSSDYHPGMGGLDIFVAEAGADGKFTKAVENLKYPINSSFDDFGIIFEGKKQRGYLTSNREGGKGSDDIWSFNLPSLTFNAKGMAMSKGNDMTGAGRGEAVELVKVKIIGTDGSIKEFTTKKDGNYDFKLKEKTQYTITTITDKSTKSPTFDKGYLASKDQRIISTIGLDKSKDFIADFELTPVVPFIRMPQILYELGKSTLLPESKDSLAFLYQTLADNPSIVVELNSHTDSRGDAAKNQVLSQERAQSCVDYLVKEKGINPARLQAKGYGKTQLLISDDVIAKAKTKQEKEALHALNRRTAFRILNWDFVDPNATKSGTTPTKTKKDGDEEDEDEE